MSLKTSTIIKSEQIIDNKEGGDCMGDTLEYLESICEGCELYFECEWDGPEDCPHSNFG